MRRPQVGRSDHSQRQRVLRIVGTVLAGALGIVAIWLIVTADTAKRTQIGALLGFWALLLAAYPVLGTRHPRVVEAGQELDLRPAGRVERADDAAERLEYERRLQLMVRHEIQAALGSELANLRAEVAALRGEILEKVGGQIRLERIETTRMVGSDIEALKHEVRQLKVATQSDDLFSVDSATALVSSLDEAVARQRAAAEAEYAARMRTVRLEPAHFVDPIEAEHLVDPAAAVDPVGPVGPVGPVHVVDAVAATARAPEGPSVRDVETANDPFASMPRIRPFTEFSLDERPEAPEDGYAGRRRHLGDAGAPYAPSGRHAGGEADWATASPSGGRRRRETDDEDDVLAKILQREGNR